MTTPDHFAAIFLAVEWGHGDLEPDVLVFRVEDHAAGTVQWTACDQSGQHLYGRQVPNTPEWTAQVQEDLREVVAEQFSVTDITFTRWNGDDW